MTSAFVTITPTAASIELTSNVFIGPPTTEHISVSDDNVAVRDLLMLSTTHIASREVLTLLGRRNGWRRVLVAVARWLLRRAA